MRRRTSSRARIVSRSSRRTSRSPRGPGVLVRAAGTALRERHARARRRQRDRHRLRRSASTTSRSTARPSLAASTSSSSTTCRATAATSSPSCCSTRTSSAAPMTSSSWAARPTACRTSRTGRPRPTPSSARSATPRLALTPSRRSGALELLQRRVRGPGGRRRDDQARRQQLTAAPAFYDFNSDSLNALTYNQTLVGRRARRSPLRHARAPVGRKPRRPARRQQDVLLRELRGLERQGHLRRRPSDRSDAGHAQRRLPRHRDHASRPADRAALPRSRSSPPTASTRRRGTSWTSSIRCPIRGRWRTATASTSSSCPRPATRQRGDLRVDYEASKNDSLFLRGELSAPRSEQRSPSRLATRSPTCRC